MNDDNNYIRVCKSIDIQEGKSIKYLIDTGLEVAIIRSNNKLFCVSNICLHNRQAKIYDGYISDAKVSCPLHGWTYDLETGDNINGGKSIKTYKIFEKNGDVFIEKPIIEKPKWANF